MRKLRGRSVLVALLTWTALNIAIPLRGVMSKTAINIATRLMGLLLAAISVEFISGAWPCSCRD